jgi:hypothetical protein
MSSWTCPYCSQIASITEVNVSSGKHEFHNRNKEQATLWLESEVTVCPNSQCAEYVIEAKLHKTEVATHPHGGRYTNRVEPALGTWILRPKSKAKPFPTYIPSPLIQDYEEACAIVIDSPKASATLSRRCLQGMIRDFWSVKKERLVDAVKDLHEKVDPATWSAIDAVRKIGNIGAHMEKDINLIVDVDPNEAEILISLIETLFKDWYVTRHDRNEQMQKIIAIASQKAALKSP